MSKQVLSSTSIWCYGDINLTVKCYLCHRINIKLTTHAAKQNTVMLCISIHDVKWRSTLRPRQKGRYFPDDIFKCIFLNENVCISIRISMKFVPKSPIKNIPALVQIMARRRTGDKPLSEPMIVNLLTHICVARSQWNNTCCRHSRWLSHKSQ